MKSSKDRECREDVLIIGFWKLCIKEKGKRKAKNFETGDDLVLAERQVDTFKCSPVRRGRLNGGQG